MNTAYPDVIRDLLTAAALDKIALETGDAAMSAAAQQALAESCDGLYTKIRDKAASYIEAGGDAKEAAAAAVVRFTLELRDTRESTGEKLASDNSQAADLAGKLVTAVYLDELFSAEMAKHASSETRQKQLLGREYIVELVRGLLG